MVTYFANDERIVFTAHLESHGPVEVTSRRPGFFSCRLRDREALKLALAEVEAYADEHKSELAQHYSRIQSTLSAA